MDDLTAGPRDTVPPAPVDAAVPVADPSSERLDRFRRWAMVLFGLFLCLVVLATVVLISAGATRGLTTLEVVVGWSGVALGAISVVALLVGLDRRRAWAFEAAVACCWILVVVAVIRVLLDLTHGAVTIPLEGIAAGLVLSRRPRPLPAVASGERRVALAVTLVFLVSEAWPVLTAAGALGAR